MLEADLATVRQDVLRDAPAADKRPVDTITDRVDGSRPLVAEDGRGPDARVPIDHQDIGRADAERRRADADLALARLRRRDVAKFEPARAN
jgi:hypothetical protein